MDVEAVSYKVLLLVDIDSCVSCDKQFHCVHGASINAVRVSALKILHFYLCLSNGKNIPFQWSYKIYTQDKRNIPNVKRQSCFQDLNLTNFETFESNIEADYAFLCCNDSEDSIDDPCDSLGRALQDVAVFFPWTISELQSPVRRRSLKPKMETKQGNGNLVFLFSFCPHSAVEMKHFAGKSVDNANTLLESFAAPELQRKLTDLCCITFVDLSSTVSTCHSNSQNTEPNSFNSSGAELMKTAFSLIKGRFLTVSSFLCLNQPQQCHISNFLTNHWKSISLHTLDSPIYPTSAKLGAYVSADDHVATTTCKLTFGFSSDSTSVDVDIVNTVYNRTNQFLTSVFTSTTKEKKTPFELHGVNMNRSEPNLPCRAVSVYGHTLCQTTVRASNICIKVKGVVLCTEENLRGHFTDEVYMVSPQRQSVESYVKHMSYFAKHRMLQVCEVCVADQSVLTGVIQPLTSSSSLLSILPRATPVQDLQQMMIPLSAGVTRQEELNEFVRKSVEHISQKKIPRSKARQNQDPGQLVLEGEGEPFNTGLLEDYYVPGSLSFGAQHLYKQTDVDGEASDEEAETMRLLQKAYLKHKARRLTDKKPTRTSPRKQMRNKSQSSSDLAGDKNPTPVLRRSPRKKPSSSFVAQDQPSTTTPMLPPPPPVLPPRNPLRRSRSHTAPSRRDVLWNKCRENIAKQKQRESGQGVTTKKHDNEGEKAVEQTSTLITEELQTRDALVKYLLASYEEILQGSSGILSSVHTLINITLHFTQTQNADNPQETACDIMSGCLSKTAKEIKSRNQDDTTQAFRELELQLLLQMELETMLRDGKTEEQLEEKAEQLAALLRAMSFSHQSGFNVADYLGKHLLDSYVETLPMLLGKLYEEFLLPLPPQMENLFSPELSTTTSVASHLPASVLPPSVGSNSSELPPSNRPRRDKAMKRYTSFHSVSSRQIQLPQQEKKRDGPRRSARTASATKNKAVSSKVQGDVKKISKNLFGSQGGSKKLERSKSMSVMEKQSVRKTPRKNSSKTTQQTPKVHHVLKSRRVTETPSHKQRSKAVWNRQEKARRRTLEAQPVQTVQESPGKALVQANKKTPKKTPKKGALMKRKSFYSMTDDARDKFEKLEARMKNKILSPTWNDNKKLVKLTSCLTSPRRVHPRTLFSNLRSPSPRKPLSLLKTPDRKNRVTSQVILNSPSFNTRSQTSERKRQLEITKTESLTPRKKVKMNLFQSPNAGQTQVSTSLFSNVPVKGLNSPVSVTPKKQTSLTFMSPVKHNHNSINIPAPLTEPVLPFRKPSNILNSPGGVNIKGILSPAKRTPKKHASMSFGSPVRCTPKKNVVLNLPESPFPVKPGQDVFDNHSLPPMRHTPGHAFSCDLVSSPSASLPAKVFQSPKPSTSFSLDSSRPRTRSASKQYPVAGTETSTPTLKARANLSSLFSDDANDGFSLNSSRQSVNSATSETNCNTNSTQHSSSISTAEEVAMVSSEGGHIQRRTLSSQSRRRTLRKADSGSSQESLQGSECNTSVKRKHSSDEDIVPAFSFKKRSRGSLYSNGVPTAEHSQEYLNSDDVFLGTRASEKPSTKSTLCSDQSNSRLSTELTSATGPKVMEGLTHLQDVTNCDSNLSIKSLPVMHLNHTEESQDSVNSPIFPPGQPEKVHFGDMSKQPFSVLDEKNREMTSLFKGMMQKNLHHTLSAHTDSSMSGTVSPVFDIPVSGNLVLKENIDSELSCLPTQTLETSIPATCNLPKPNIKSPFKVHPQSEIVTVESSPPKASTRSKSPGTTPVRSGTRRSPGKSPTLPSGRMTPMCSPTGSTKYSPLTSTRSLAMLMESPLLAHSGGKRKNNHSVGTPTSHNQGKSSKFEDGKSSASVSENDSVTESRRHTRRSLYRTQTNPNLD